MSGQYKPCTEDPPVDVTTDEKLARWKRFVRVAEQHPDWFTEPMPSGVPHVLVERGGRP